MYKVSHFHGVDPQSGESLIQVYRPGDIGSLEKTAANLQPDLKKFLSTLDPDKKKLYVLIIALGAGEYYSSNINGDHFPEAGLSHIGTDYGHRTFLNGHVFAHHKNKDPQTSFGGIPFATWNDSMKRSDLVLALDRARAKQFGSQDIIDKIDAGVPCSVSMGCKVDFDRCSICGNKSKTRADYCIHASQEMNKIYPDGRKVFVYNDYPRFFDLSFVFIGADRIAKTLCKIASGGCCELCSLVGNQGSAKMAEDAGWTEKTGAVKVASRLNIPLLLRKKAALRSQREKDASQKKISDIFKDVPSSFIRQSVPLLESQEPDIPDSVLDDLGANYPLGDALATPSFMGMVLKPREYQRIILIQIGQKSVADDLDARGEVFCPEDGVDDSVQFGRFRRSIFEKLAPILGLRSGFGPVLQRRMMGLLVSQPKTAGVKKFARGGFLTKIAQGYNAYRLQLLSVMPGELQDVLDSNGKLTESFYGESFNDMFAKEAEVPAGSGSLKPLLGIFPALYLLSAHWKDQELHGRRLNFIQKFVAENPGLSSLLVAGAIVKFRQHRSKALVG